MLPSELRDFGEVEIANLHRRNHHVKRFLAGGANRFAHGFYIREHVYQTFVETKVTNSLLLFAVFHEERSVAGHAGYHLFERLDFADVPESRDQYAALGGSDHVREALRILWCGEN